MILRAAASTDVGMRRRENQDRYALAPDLGLYLVADGMGGHSAGQVASKLAAEACLRAVRALEGAHISLAEKLRHAVACSNREIYATAQTDESLKGMGTTLVAILDGDGRAALAHVGDSRTYLIRGGRVRRLTDDHSVVGELVRRHEISEEAARDHPHRHVLTRALGVTRNVQLDLAELSPMENDVFVMCSDGLTGHVSDDEIAATVMREEDLHTCCDQLIALANARGGEDNVTVAALRYERS